MRTELDQRMDAVMAAMTGEGGQLPVATMERFGQTLPYIAAAPPTLNAYFAHFCAQHRDVEFLVAGDERLTFGQVYDAATRVAHALVDGYGIGKGDRVGIAARNSPSWIVLYMGILMAGGVATLLNGWWQTEEFETAIRDVGVRMVFADPPRARRLAAIAGLSDVAVETFDDLKPLQTALDPVFAWIYVAIRIVHSIWQATVNIVSVRFLLFLLSTLALICLAWRAVALTLFADPTLL